MQLAKRVLFAVGAVLLTLVLLVAGALLFIMRTDAGRGWLAAALNDQLARPDGSGFHIGRIGGPLPGRVELTDIALRDGQGVWLTVPSAVVSWRPLALLSGDVEIELVDVDGVRVWRCPVGGQPGQSKSAGRFGWPTLPAEVTVERLSVRDVQLAEPVLGVAASLRAAGRLASREAGAISTDLTVERTDGNPGRLELAAELLPEDGFLRVALTASEPPGGLIARALAVPDLPPVSIRLAGEGPLQRWRGKLAATLGEAVGADADVTLTGRGEDYALDAAGRARIAPLLPEPVRQLAGDGMEFSVQGRTRGAELVEVARARAVSDAATAAIAGTIDLAQRRIDGRAEVAIVQPAALQPIIGPVDTSGVALTAQFAGPLVAPEIRAHAEAVRIAHSQGELRDVRLDVAVVPEGALRPGGFRGAVTATANVGSVMAQQPQAAALLTGPISGKLESAIDIPARRLRVAEFWITAPDLRVAGSGEANLESWAANAALQVSAPDLAPFSGALGFPLSGGVGASASIRAEAGFQDAQAKIAATLSEIASPQAPLKEIFGSSTTLDAELTTDAAGTHRTQIRVAAAGLNASAGGSFSPGFERIEAEYQATVTNLSAFSALAGTEMAGRAVLSGSATGPSADPSLTAVLHVDKAALGAQRLGVVDAKLHVESPGTGPRGKIEISVNPPSGRTKGAGNFAIVDQSLRLTEAEINVENAAKDNRLVVSGLDLRAGPFNGGVPVAVEAKARWTNRKPDRSGTIGLTGQALVDRAAGRYAARNTSLRFEAVGAGLPPSGIKGELSAEAAADLTAQTARAAVTLNALDAKAEAQLRVEALSGKQRFRGKLVVGEFDPKALLKRLGRAPPATRDEDVLEKASLELTLSGDSSGVTVEPIQGRLDQSRLNGQVTVRNYAKPLVRFDIRIDQLNLDRYLPATPGKPPSAGSDNAVSSISREDLRALGLDLRGAVRVGRLTLNGDRTDDFVAKIEWDP